MKLNLLDYKNQVRNIETLLTFNPSLKYNELSIITYCPILVVCYIHGLLYGFTDELKEYIDFHEKYYKWDIINLEELKEYVESRRSKETS